MGRGNVLCTWRMSFAGFSVWIEAVGQESKACRALVLSSPELGCAATAERPSTLLNTSGAIHRHVEQSIHRSSTKNSPETFCRRRRRWSSAAGGEDAAAVARTNEAARQPGRGGGAARDAAARRLSAMELASVCEWRVNSADLLLLSAT